MLGRQKPWNHDLEFGTVEPMSCTNQLHRLIEPGTTSLSHLELVLLKVLNKQRQRSLASTHSRR